ncbi:MAG: DUF2339 domain-containing protein [Candidatus Gracilibacteria bacterium]|nr:DUF2339 domain-containing protein [Candidatus Gracilibacteria bacterium]
MFKLLNRFAWFISLSFGFIIALIIIGTNSYSLGGEEVFFSGMLGLIFGFIIKKLFLSKSYIESRLEFFAEALNKNPNKVKIKNEEKNETPEVEFVEQTQDFEETNEYISKDMESKEKIQKVQKNKKPSKLALYIKQFFAENLLAKLGGILVFLGVLFLLSLVYSAIGPVGKLIIGFSIGFFVYFVGVWLDKKKLENEARVLLGIAILINYLVILGGRYLIGDNVDNSYLQIGTTFLFLIFNTVFAVVTSLLYKSRTLLLFSFIFAFLNPLLIGGSSDNPYTLSGYSLIVSFGGLYLGTKHKDILLTLGVFILGNLLFLIAPYSSDLHWIIKLASSAILSISSILAIYNINSKKLSLAFGLSYVFLIILLGTGDNYLKETTSFVSYMIAILVYFGLGIYYFIKTSFNSVIYILLLPIFIILGLCYTSLLLSIPLTLAIIVLAYLIGFNFAQNKFPSFLKYTFFVILGIFIILTNSYLSIEKIVLELPSFITVLVVSFVFIFTSYYLSTKKDLEYLYSIGTIGGIFTLAPILVTKLTPSTTSFYLSIFSLLLFSILNWILPYINRNLIEKSSNLKNLVIGIIAGVLFLGFEIYNYGTLYFPGISLGYAFLGLAIVYFVLAYFMINKIGVENIKKEETSKNAIYTYLGVTISLFSLAIAYIFSGYEAVISAIWLFEASLLFYFYNKTSENKIATAGIILFAIGVSKLYNLIPLVETRDFVFLIPFAIIFISLVLNIKFVSSKKLEGINLIHDILHILGIGILGVLLLKIIPSTGHGWSTLGISVFLSFIATVYAYFNSMTLKYFFIVIFTIFGMYQIGGFEGVVNKLDRDSLSNLIILQYTSTILLGYIAYVWNKLNSDTVVKNILNIIFSIYIIIITSLYIYDIFDTTFAVTIYWGLAASIILFYGIGKDIIKLRTIGLYLIILTSMKIFGYDIWYGIEDAVSRVVALIVIGTLFIIISTRYTKKYGNNISGEFNINNLK